MNCRRHMEGSQKVVIGGTDANEILVLNTHVLWIISII